MPFINIPKGCSRKTYQFREDFHGLVRYFITCDLWDWETNLDMFFRKFQESYSKSRDKEHGISSLWLLHMKGCCPISYSLLKLVASSRVTNNLSFKSWRLERWLSGEEHWLLHQRTRVQYPAPTRQHIIVCTSSSRGCDILTQPYMQAKHQCTWNTE